MTRWCGIGISLVFVLSAARCGQQAVGSGKRGIAVSQCGQEPAPPVFVGSLKLPSLQETAQDLLVTERTQRP